MIIVIKIRPILWLNLVFDMAEVKQMVINAFGTVTLHLSILCVERSSSPIVPISRWRLGCSAILPIPPTTIFIFRISLSLWKSSQLFGFGSRCSFVLSWGSSLVSHARVKVISWTLAAAAWVASSLLIAVLLPLSVLFVMTDSAEVRKHLLRNWKATWLRL